MKRKSLTIWTTASLVLLLPLAAALSQTATVIKTIDVDGAIRVAFQPPDGSVAYVTGGDKVSVIDTASHTVGNVIPLAGAGSIAFTPDGSKAYVCAGHEVIVIDTTDQTTGPSISFPATAVDVDVSPDGSKAYVATGDWGEPEAAVGVIDTATDTARDPIVLPIRTPCWGVAFAPDGRDAYVSCYYTGSIFVIDAHADELRPYTIAARDGPHAIAFTPDGQWAYVSNEVDVYISRIDVANSTPTCGRGIPVPDIRIVYGLASCPESRLVYATNSRDDTVMVIETDSCVVTADPIEVGDGPIDVAFKPYGNVAYVTNYGDGTVSVIAVAVVTAAVDIEPETLNLNSQGKWITCYIEPPEGYAVEDIHIDSIRLKREDFDVGGEYGEFQTYCVMVKFPRSELQGALEPGEVEFRVTGQLTDGTRIEGTDTIRVMDKGDKKE